MAENAKFTGSNVIQFFLRNPEGSHERNIDPDDVIAFKAYCDEYSIDTLIGYAPYTINPCTNDVSKRDFSQSILAEDIAHMEEFPNQFYGFHPGHAIDMTHEEGIENAAEMLNAIIAPTQTTKLLIVENSGEGTEICSTFEEIASLIQKIKHQDHIGVCFDTCAAWAAGYDIVNDLDKVLDDFDRVVGIDKIAEVHLTDSKEGLGSHVDRHATFGEGQIGFEALVKVMENPRLKGLPFVLEEPRPDIEEYRTQISALHMALK